MSHDDATNRFPDATTEPATEVTAADDTTTTETPPPADGLAAPAATADDEGFTLDLGESTEASRNAARRLFDGAYYSLDDEEEGNVDADAQTAYLPGEHLDDLSHEAVNLFESLANQIVMLARDRLAAENQQNPDSTESKEGEETGSVVDHGPAGANDSNE